MDFLRVVAAVVVGGAIYYLATTDIPAALGLLGAFVMMAAGWNEARMDRIGKAMDANFTMLRHLQRMPSGEPFNND